VGGYTFIREEKRYSCLKCHYLTYRQDKIRQHMVAHQGSCVCHVCGKAFIKTCDLDRHMIAHAAGRLKPHNIIHKTTAGAMKVPVVVGEYKSELSLPSQPAPLPDVHDDDISQSSMASLPPPDLHD
jgi:hypothetical protein